MEHKVPWLLCRHCCINILCNKYHRKGESESRENRKIWKGCLLYFNNCTAWWGNNLTTEWLNKFKGIKLFNCGRFLCNNNTNLFPTQNVQEQPGVFSNCQWCLHLRSNISYDTYMDSLIQNVKQVHWLGPPTLESLRRCFSCKILMDYNIQYLFSNTQHQLTAKE